MGTTFKARVARIRCGVFMAVVSLAKIGAAQAIPPVIGTELPEHLVVQFHVTSIENVATAGAGVALIEGSVPLINFELTGDPAVVTSEHSPYSLPLPAPSTELGLLVGHPALMYEGLVEEGCGHTPNFPVSLHSAVYVLSDAVVEYGQFSASDDDTIAPTGYWSFSYHVAISDGVGNASDIQVRGTVSALCALPSELDLPERFQGGDRFLFPTETRALRLPTN